MATRRTLTHKRKRRIAERRNWIAVDGEPLCLEKGRVVLLATGGSPEFDHAVQLALGGSDDDDNLRPMSPEAHAEKSKRDAAARKKVRHLTGANKPKPKFRWPKGRKLGIPGLRKKLNGKVERRV